MFLHVTRPPEIRVNLVFNYSHAASIQSSLDNLFYSFIVLLDNEYFLISSLHRTFINDTSCPLVIVSFLSDITVFLSVFAHPTVLIR